MEILETLAVALGFATLAGLNLYLTVLITGVAINQGWVNVAQSYPELMVLGEPGVIMFAGIFFALEFFSDKIPWVDSLWDTVHTLVRPVGGGLLAMHTIGSVDPAFEVVIGMLAGGATLVTHGFKSGTRLAVNASPEPFTNIAASVTEDVAVIGGLALMSQHPLLAAGICIVFLSLCIYLTPKLFRRMKAFFWLLAHKIGSGVVRSDEEELLYGDLTMEEDLALSKLLDGRKPEVKWSARALVGTRKKFRAFVPNTFGRLIAEAGSTDTLHFIGKRLWRPYHAAFSLSDLDVTQESRFFSEDVVIYSRSDSKRLTLRFPSGQKAIANRVVEELLQTGRPASSSIAATREKALSASSS